MFSAQSLLAGNGAGVTFVRESREPITTLNVATYVTPLVNRNFWLCFFFKLSSYVLVAQLTERPLGVGEVMGSIPVGDSDISLFHAHVM